MSSQTIPLAAAYEIVLGGVMAISPDLYRRALERMAAMTGRVNDEAFRAEVDKIGRMMPCDFD